MKGYRTLIFSVAVMVLGMTGHHVAPETVNSWLDLIFAAVGVGIVSLRLMTTTPFGQAVLADVGLSAGTISDDLRRIVPDAPASLGDALTDFSSALDKLSGHPLMKPGTLSALVNLANAVTPAPDGGDASGGPSAMGQAVTDPPPAPQPQPQPQPQPPAPAPQPPPVAL